MRHVELEEARAGAVSFCNRFDGRGARGAKAVGEVEFFGHGCDGQFAERVVDFVDADWGEADGGGDFVAEDCGRRVAKVSVDELAGDDSVSEEGLTVGEVGVGLTGVGGGIVPVVG